MERPVLRPAGTMLWEVSRDYRADMRVPARVFADRELLGAIVRDRSIEQLVNVATLPGILGAALGMPDMHEGYGFPVGGVAATALPDGVISPGGIGFDINCGVRLLVSPLRRGEIAPHVERLVHELSRSVPAGYGRGGRFALDPGDLDRVLAEGVPWLVSARGVGRPEDVDHVESSGALEGADPAHVSERAKTRGRDQLGTLGGGNHFLEIQWVDEVYDPRAATAMGLEPERVSVLVHTGSRGLGHQVCTDYIKAFEAAMPRHGLAVPDRQLACAPFSSPEGGRYFAAMCAAANFGFANRQLIAERVREAFRRILPAALDPDLRLVYDLAHNTAKVEEHGARRLCVHRKGATRAFGPSRPEVPRAYRETGQPVFIPGSMGTSSFVLVGTDDALERSFGSACHGAGRRLSRGAAKREVAGHQLRRELEARGIVVRCPSNEELAEEAPSAYKDVERVVDVVAGAGLARKVARLRPLGVLKG